MPMKPVDESIRVIVGPLIDDTDFKTREESIAYNQAGMEIDVIVEKSDGTVVTTAVTPTTAGDYDWVHLDQGYYSLELPETGGVSFNNTEEGQLTVVGFCDEVLPFRSVTYDIMTQNTYQSFIKGNDLLDVSVEQLQGVGQSLTDLKDFVDFGYDPATNKVEGVKLVDTTTSNSDMRGTDGALTDKTGFSLSSTGLDAIASTATGMVEIAKAIWDRVLTGGTHNINNSAGKRLRQLEAGFVIRSGTAQTGTSNTITLDAGASAIDDIYRGDRVLIIAGTGAQEHGIITSYNGTTKVATMSENWVITPDATSEFELTPADADIETWNHNAVTGDGDWTTLQGDVTTLLGRITSTLFSGVTSLAEWLGLLAGKQVADATALAEIKDTGAGSGTYNESTDSQEAIRDRGDSAWLGWSSAELEQIRHRLNLDGTQTPPTAGGAAKLAGTDAALTLKSIAVSNPSGDAVSYISTGSNGRGLYVLGDGSGAGIFAQGGETGDGIKADSGFLSGAGINAYGVTIGIRAYGDSSLGIGILAIGTSAGITAKVETNYNGNGILIQGGDDATGSALKIEALATDAEGIEVIATGTGAGIKTTGGANGEGLLAQGGSVSGSGGKFEAQGGNSHGLETVKSGSGIDLKATDHGDNSWEGDSAIRLQSTTITNLVSQVEFDLVAGSADDRAYEGCYAIVTDVSTSTQKAVGIVQEYTGATKTIKLLADPAVFTMADTDKIDIIAAKDLVLQQTLEGTPQGEVNTAVAPTSTTIEIDTLTNVGGADYTVADVLKNRTLTFRTGACKGQQVAIKGQAAIAAGVLALTTTPIAGFAGISDNDRVEII